MIQSSFQNQPLADITIQLPLDLQSQVREMARQQGETISEMIRLALEIYLQQYRQQKEIKPRKLNLNEARQLMRKLGQGLGEGSAPHNTARHHDAYLYTLVK